MTDEDDTGRRRRISASEVDAIARVQLEIAEHQARSERSLAAERHHAEWFGADGRSGRIGAMETKVSEHDADISDLKLFRARALWTVSLLATLGGALAALAAFAVSHFLK